MQAYLDAHPAGTGGLFRFVDGLRDHRRGGCF